MTVIHITESYYLLVQAELFKQNCMADCVLPGLIQADYSLQPVPFRYSNAATSRHLQVPVTLPHAVRCCTD